MDIFIQGVPSNVNHVELRIFLKEKLRDCNILAFDIYKKYGANYAILTVPDPKNGRTFLHYYGERVPLPLVMRNSKLRCKKSNRAGQPSPMKIVALLREEDELRMKGSKLLTQGPQSNKPTFRFVSMTNGLWNCNKSAVLQYDSKFKDSRSGYVTFGRSALVLYLQRSDAEGFNWHCRIDIPHVIIEHVVPSIESGKQAGLTFTLKSPPKIYQIETTEGLHLYTGGDEMDLSTQFKSMNLQPENTPPLHRLCALQPHHTRNAGLCMVYKLQFSSIQVAHHAWNFVRDYTVPDAHCWKHIPRCDSMSVEEDYDVLQELLIACSSLDSKFGFSFSIRFQLLALVLEGTIPPSQIRDILPDVHNAAAQHGSELAALGVKKLGQQIPTPAPHLKNEAFLSGGIANLIRDNIQDIKDLEQVEADLSKRRKQSHLALTYKATVTPTGIVLRGPDWGVSNRVLRKYRHNTEYFMRVFFADEDGLSVFHDPRASQTAVYARFSQVLKEGIRVAERNYEFLGFSHSSLRYHQAWFMAPFCHEGKLLCASDVIRDLGDFTRIHCSAKCAARIGQAFSDTIFAVPVPKTAYVTEEQEDVVRNGYTFSDGCGTISLDLLQKIWRALPPDRRAARPTVLQVRYRGAKGVVSLDTSLEGEQLLIRNSMTKYVAKEGWRDLELCGAAYKPLTMLLNHQFIKILEDLGVPERNFLSVQNDALKVLEMVIKHPVNAASFLEYSYTGVVAKVPRLFELMHHIGLSFQTDKFLTDVVEIAAMASLRDLKYRARLPVSEGHLLYGIMDETGVLKEGEVYISIQRNDNNGNLKREIIVNDRVVVTRAPALHPGDVQLAKAVDVPPCSPLRDLRNCIVFSQHGARDLPSQLSGGDLDGDLFHVIYDERLVPPSAFPPAEYAPAKAKDLGRPVEVDDIVDFFIEFMNMDRLGQISNKHKIRADIKPDGTFDHHCITLAKLASDAVDFSKSGNPADLSLIPPGQDHIRPDFMAPGHNLVINELGATELAELEEENPNDPDSLSALDPRKARIFYYRSEKVLGKLYRNIDERKFFDQMKDDFRETQNRSGGKPLLTKLEEYVNREIKGIQWEHHITFAEELREYYEENMLEIMDTLRPHRGEPLTELEVFSGNILGKKERASTRYIREANLEVQERFNRDVGDIIKRIIMGDEDADGIADAEALPRAIACFTVALQTEGWENYITLRSWKYVAAAVCLEQLSRYHGGLLRPYF